MAAIARGVVAISAVAAVVILSAGQAGDPSSRQSLGGAAGDGAGVEAVDELADGEDDQAEAAAGLGVAPSPTATLEPTATPIPSPTPVPRGSVTFAFGGDVHFEGRLRSTVLDDAAGALIGIDALLGSADLAMVNLETAVTDRGTPAQKAFVFRSPPEGLDALLLAGVDVVSNANNHTIDFGREGLEDTIVAARDAGLPMVGVGLDEATAYAPWTTTINQTSIAVFGASQVLDGFAVDTWPARADRSGLASARFGYVDLLLANVREAAATTDVVVVYVHWGIEANDCPSSDQVVLAQELAAAGADIVVGAHAHRLQGAGFLGDTFVGYGLGNFVFESLPDQLDSGVLEVTVHPDNTIEAGFVPARLVNGVAQPLTGEDRAAAAANFATLQPCTGLTGDVGS